MSNDAQESGNGDLPAIGFTRQNTDVMSRMDKIAQESMDKTGDDLEAKVAEFSLSGLVPRAEPESIRRFRSKDVYVRLENRIYGPLTQDELGELLASGKLTGFESASSDLRTWTPLIYHPKMTLAGEIDPDQTHDVLHKRSDLPAASRAAEAIDLETFGEEPEMEKAPAMPLAAILIKPVRVSRKTGEVLDAPVLADLDQESLEDVIERTGIPEMPPIPADASGDNRRAADRQAKLTPPPLPPASSREPEPAQTAPPQRSAQYDLGQPTAPEQRAPVPAPMPLPLPVAPVPALEPMHAAADLPLELELPDEPIEFEITSEPISAAKELQAPRTSSTSPGIPLTEQDREKHSEYVRSFFTTSSLPVQGERSDAFEAADVGGAPAPAADGDPSEEAQSSAKMMAIAVFAGMIVLAIAWFVLTKLSGTPAL